MSDSDSDSDGLFAKLVRDNPAPGSIPLDVSRGLQLPRSRAGVKRVRDTAVMRSEEVVRMRHNTAKTQEIQQQLRRSLAVPVDALLPEQIGWAMLVPKESMSSSDSEDSSSESAGSLAPDFPDSMPRLLDLPSRFELGTQDTAWDHPYVQLHAIAWPAVKYRRQQLPGSEHPQAAQAQDCKTCIQLLDAERQYKPDPAAQDLGTALWTSHGAAAAKEDEGVCIQTLDLLPESKPIFVPWSSLQCRDSRSRTPIVYVTVAHASCSLWQRPWFALAALAHQRADVRTEVQARLGRGAPSWADTRRLGVQAACASNHVLHLSLPSAHTAEQGMLATWLIHCMAGAPGRPAAMQDHVLFRRWVQAYCRAQAVYDKIMQLKRASQPEPRPGTQPSQTEVPETPGHASDVDTHITPMLPSKTGQTHRLVSGTSHTQLPLLRPGMAVLVGPPGSAQRPALICAVGNDAVGARWALSMAAVQAVCAGGGEAMASACTAPTAALPQGTTAVGVIAADLSAAVQAGRESDVPPDVGAVTRAHDLSGACVAVQSPARAGQAQGGLRIPASTSNEPVSVLLSATVAGSAHCMLAGGAQVQVPGHAEIAPASTYEWETGYLAVCPVLEEDVVVAAVMQLGLQQLAKVGTDA